MARFHADRLFQEERRNSRNRQRGHRDHERRGETGLIRRPAGDGRTDEAADQSPKPGMNPTAVPTLRIGRDSLGNAMMISGPAPLLTALSSQQRGKRDCRAMIKQRRDWPEHAHEDASQQDWLSADFNLKSRE